MEKELETCFKNKIKEQMDKFDKNSISSLIFTTYDFETEFFENQLLPYLFDISNARYIKNQGLLIASKIEEKLKFKEDTENSGKIKLTVFYDHFINDIQANINYHAIPINDKCLHAKIIIITGRKKDKKTATIIISSANISISSYSTNQEVFGITDTDNIDLIDTIDNSNNLYEILEKLNELPELIITGVPGIKENKILKMLQPENSKGQVVRVITPFVEKSIIQRLCQNQKLEILFTNLRGIGDKEGFKEILNCASDDLKLQLYTGERKIHSKIYLLENEKVVIIGSHNLTRQAIDTNNIEASMIFYDKNYYNKVYDHYDKLDKEEINQINYEEKIMESNTNIRKEYISSAEIDWNKEEILIILDEKSIGLNSNTHKSVNLIQIGNDRLNKEIKLSKTEEGYTFNFSTRIDIKQKLMKSKLFKIRIEIIENIKKFESNGIFYEIQKIDKEKILETDTYFDIVEARLTKNHKVELEDEVTEEIYTHENENQHELISSNELEELDKYDIVKLFIFYKKINEEIKNSTDLEKLYKINPDSIKTLVYNFLKLYDNEKNNLQDNNKLLYMLLTAKELDELLKKYDIGNIKFNNINLENVLDNLKIKSVERIKRSLKIDSDEISKKILDIYWKYI